MSGRINLLSALLAVQLVIIAAVLLAGPGYTEQEAGPFLEFDAERVDEIRITGDGDNAEPVVLTRTDDGWRLPSGLPADETRVNETLDRLAGLRAPWPVATSGGAAARFEVTEDDFQRHLVLRAGDETVVDLYTGTSPGYQQVHARRAGDDAVFSVALANYQFPPQAEDWLDKTLLQPQGEISSVARQGGWTLSRAEEGWQLDNGPANQQAAAELVRRISQLRVSGIGEPPAQDSTADAVLVVNDEAGEQRLAFYAGAGEGEEYRLTSDRREGTFTLARYLAEQLLLDAPALRPAPEGEAASAGEAPGGAAPPAEGAGSDGDAAPQ